MTSYLISYDLNKPGQEYTRLIETIKSYGTWWHHLESTWIVTTSDTAVQIRDKLKPYLDTGDELLVVALTGVGAWRGFNEKGSAWLKEHL